MTEPTNGHEFQPYPEGRPAEDNTRLQIAASPHGTIALVVVSGSLQILLDLGKPDAAEELLAQIVANASQLADQLRRAQSGIQLPGMPGFVDPKGIDPEQMRRFMQGDIPKDR